MYYAVTGHRPKDLYADGRTADQIKDLFRKWIESRATQVSILTGMALGFDQLVAEVCCELGIRWMACIPFEGQESVWPHDAQVQYYDLLRRSTHVNYCWLQKPASNVEATKLLHQRNRWMVDNSDALIACWNGVKSGGTYNCVSYAESVDRKIVNLLSKGPIDNPDSM